MYQLRHSCNNQAWWLQLMTAARNSRDLRRLKPIHALFVTSGHTLTLRRHLAGPHAPPSCFLSNALLAGYSRSRLPLEALRCFRLLLRATDAVADHWSFNFAVLACVNGLSGLGGIQIHGLAVKNGLAVFDGHVQTALVRFYCKCRNVDDARKLFDEIPLLDVFHCNAVMHGYVETGLASEALSVFWEMLEFGVEPDEHCLITAIKACAQLGSVSAAVRMHSYVNTRSGVRSRSFLETALVDMYAKCGDLDAAVRVFEKIHRRSVFAWTTMISAFGDHGYVAQAFHCLETMKLDDPFTPNDSAITAMLRAYASAGVAKECRFLLLNMESRYGISPTRKHYGCVVDSLCREGQLWEALGIIRKMPMKPLASVWGAMLCGCRIHNDDELEKLAFDELRALESWYKVGDLVQLFDIYLAVGRNKDADRVRKMMHSGAEEKLPVGLSRIEVNGTENEFISGVPSPSSHQAQIIKILDLIYTCSIRDKRVECIEVTAFDS